MERAGARDPETAQIDARTCSIFDLTKVEMLELETSV
jgi:hypothetical protein